MRDQVFQYYPLIGGGKFGVERQPMNACHSKEQAFRCANYCLQSMMPGIYRLLSNSEAKPHHYQHFNIHCPTCGSKLINMSSAIDEHTLPLYGCKYCR